jgi:hypothetical protein
MRPRPVDLFDMFPDLPRFVRAPLGNRLENIRENARKVRERAKANARRQKAAARAVRDRIARLRQARRAGRTKPARP